MYHPSMCPHNTDSICIFLESVFSCEVHSFFEFFAKCMISCGTPTFSLNLPANPLQLLVCLLAAVACSLPDIANGNASIGPSTHPNIVLITCNAGFQLIGDDVVVCTGTEFRSPPGICIGMCYYVLHVLTHAFHLTLRSELHVHAAFSCLYFLVLNKFDFINLFT